MNIRSALTIMLVTCMLSVTVRSETLPQNIGRDYDRATPAAGNRPPTITMTPSAIIELGYDQQFTLTTQTTDPDGDTRDIYWEYMDQGMSLVTNTSTFTQATFKTKTSPGTYDVMAHVVDARGLKAAATTRVLVRDHRTPRPSPPTNLRYTAKTHYYVSLAWNRPTTGRVLWYVISRRLNSPPGQPWEIIGNTYGTELTYRDNSVRPSTTYQYVVQAQNEGGSSLPSNAYALTTSAPPPPNPAYPNLVPGTFTLPPVGNKDAGYFIVAVTVKNMGAALARGPWYVRVTESVDATRSTDDRVLRTLRFDDLSPGATTTDDFSFTPTRTTEGKKFWYFAHVDHDARITESNESDNVTSTMVTYQTFYPPTGFQCVQTGYNSVRCTCNTGQYDAFTTFIVENHTFYCDEEPIPTCDVYGLDSGVYQIQMQGHDAETHSSRITAPIPVVVSEELD